MSEKKFKIGDRVRVTGGWYTHGAEGVVFNIEESGFVWFTPDDPSCHPGQHGKVCCLDESLEVIEGNSSQPPKRPRVEYSFHGGTASGCVLSIDSSRVEIQFTKTGYKPGELDQLFEDAKHLEQLAAKILEVMSGSV